MVCREMEPRLEEKPTSQDRKPEAAEQLEVPVEDPEVMTSRQPKKIRPRDINKPKFKKWTQEKNGC